MVSQWNPGGMETGRQPVENRGKNLKRKNGGLAGTRTLDQCLKRALLYQLSYQPTKGTGLQSYWETVTRAEDTANQKRREN
jgi:hypothetical protein